ncbi:DUF4102 domain-containing protein [Sandaracinobacter neustonicus]|uniref:DUF4102 domain-containing protein n=1 Tax=Sandaracinobacter neustonicus TaxID=1715348 RepID=A0A501XWS0_9SPHN|nr:Arm DNA-binding domain-containing protein [Sandaracinobacter neustonicus]TPE64793.1 DUF4102 domain-containing protein [Sandaracinobacter neustonicus]
MALTEIAIRAAKGREKPYKMTDSGGLYLLVQPNGSKYWRQKYRRLGREGKLSIGNYPDISLREARKRSGAAKEQLAAHKDPVREKQKAIQEAQLLATNTFELVAAEYCERRRADGYRPWAPAKINASTPR